MSRDAGLVIVDTNDLPEADYCYRLCALFTQHGLLFDINKGTLLVNISWKLWIGFILTECYDSVTPDSRGSILGTAVGSISLSALISSVLV